MLGEESKFLGRGKARAAARLRASEGRNLASASPSRSTVPGTRGNEFSLNQ